MTNLSISLSTAADFGDARLNKRLEVMTTSFSEDLRASIPDASGGKHGTKASYRFFDNSKVTDGGIIQAHAKVFQAHEFDSDVPVRVLQLSDTVEFDYTGKKGADQLGCLNYPNRRGIYLHNSLMVNNFGVPLGVLKQTYWLRSESDLGQSAARRKLPLDQKESYRWYDHFKAGEALCKEYENLEVVYVADREADFMELLTAREHPRMHYVIRSQYNRNLQDDSDKLWNKVGKSEVRTTYKVQIQHPKTKKKRVAEVEVRFCPLTIELQRKRLVDGTKLPAVTLNAIEVREINPPSDIEEPIYWVLLTTLEVNTIEDALQVIGYYIHRWTVERFHYTLKSGGAQVEELQLGTPHRLKNAIATYSISVMNVMKIKYLAEHQPDTKINEIGITSLEQEVLYNHVHQFHNKKVKYAAKEIPTIKEFCIVLAMLVGFHPSKRQPLPGLKRLTKASMKFELIYKAASTYIQDG